MPGDFRAAAMDDNWLWQNVNCRFTCPVHTDAGAYVSLIGAGRWEEAYNLARQPNPLVRVCSRICAHPCETECRRGKLDAPVSICALKRFAVEFGEEVPDRTSLACPVPRSEKVAVVGAGPAGLAAAHDLALMGYRVTLFEAQQVLGGMLRLGIPDYRLPRDVLGADVAAIRQLDIEVRTGQALGSDFTLHGLKRDGYAAVFLAVGATRSRALPVPGNDLEGIFPGVDFLQEVNLGRPVVIGQKVVVIGGGNVAIDVARSALRVNDLLQGDQAMTTAADVARSALRLGAHEVHLLCLESRGNMPAAVEEVAEAENEGVILHPARGPQRFLEKNGRVAAVVVQEVTSLFDQEGRFNPTFYPDRDETVLADTVILAIGQQSDLSFLKPADQVKVSPRGTIQVDEETLATTAPGIFAGGDVAFGPRIAIAAIADGRRAARSIHRHLTGQPMTDPVPALSSVVVEPRPTTDGYHRLPRQAVPTVEVNRRAGGREVELGYDVKTAQLEARRCLQCFLNPWVDEEACILCGGCVDVCPYSCLQLVPLERVGLDEKARELVATRLQVPAPWVEGYPGYDPDGGEWTVMLKDEEKCIRCGLCVQRCPAGAMKMRCFTPAGVENGSERRVVGHVR